MHPSNIRKLHIRVSTLLLIPLFSGCLATTDLAKDKNIDPNIKSLARNISEMAKDRCITYKFRQDNNQKLSGDKKINDYPEVKRLYSSSGNWWKAEMVASSVWDNVYYNTSTREFVCGEKQWQRKEAHEQISFKSVDASNIISDGRTKDEAQKISIPGTSTMLPNEKSNLNSIIHDDNLFSKSVLAHGPDIAESGCVVPIALTFKPPIVAGNNFQLMLNSRKVAEVEVIKGAITEFQFRGKMSNSGEVLGLCSGCKSTPKFISVASGCNLFEKSSGDGFANIRTNGGEFKSLMNGNFADGALHITGGDIEVKVTPTIYTTDRTFIGMKTIPPFNGEGCIEVSDSNKSIIRKSCGFN